MEVAVVASVFCMLPVASAFYVSLCAFARKSREHISKMNNQNLDEIRKLIQALLLSRNGATAVPLLERNYYDAENTRIPYRQFGYYNLVEFLQSFPEHFIVEQYNGGHYVRGIPSERSRHVSSLVSRLRTRECIRNDQS